MKYLIEFLGLYVLLAPLGLLPIRVGRKAGEFVGLMAYHLLGVKRRRAIGNIRTVVERGGIDLRGRTPEAVAKGLFVHVGRSLAEIANLLMGGRRTVAATVRVEGRENFTQAHELGRGVIFVTGHMGNWELASLTFPRFAGEIWGVARRQKNPHINRRIERMRQAYGGHVVYQEGALRKFISVLSSGGTVGIVMDETVKPERGVEVEFMGGGEYKSRMCAILARRTGASIVPALATSVRGETVVHIHPALQLTGDDATDTRAIMRVFEGHIGEHPDQWLLWLRIWRRGRQRDMVA